MNSEKLMCPLCGGEVEVHQKIVKCKDAHCGWGLWRTIAGKYLTDDVVETLLTIGKTEALNGFVGKSGKSFKTALQMNAEGRIDFIFPNRNRRGGRGLRLTKRW